MQQVFKERYVSGLVAFHRASLRVKHYQTEPESAIGHKFSLNMFSINWLGNLRVVT